MGATFVLQTQKADQPEAADFRPVLTTHNPLWEDHAMKKSLKPVDAAKAILRGMDSAYEGPRQKPKARDLAELLQELAEARKVDAQHRSREEADREQAVTDSEWLGELAKTILDFTQYTEPEATSQRLADEVLRMNRQGGPNG